VNGTWIQYELGILNTLRMPESKPLQSINPVEQGEDYRVLRFTPLLHKRRDSSLGLILVESDGLGHLQFDVIIDPPSLFLIILLPEPLDQRNAFYIELLDPVAKHNGNHKAATVDPKECPGISNTVEYKT